MNGCRDAETGAVVEKLSSEYQKPELNGGGGYRFYDSQAVLGYLPDNPPSLLHSIGTVGEGTILVKSTLGKLAT